MNDSAFWETRDQVSSFFHVIHIRFSDTWRPLFLLVSSVAQSCPTLGDPMKWSTPGFPVHHQLPEIAQTHVHRVGDPTISSSVVPFSSCLQSFSASGSFPMSRFFASGGQSIKALVSASVLPMNIQDWFPLELTGWISLPVQGTLKSLLQHHSSKASILQRSAFFMVQLSHPYMTTGNSFKSCIFRFHTLHSSNCPSCDVVLPLPHVSLFAFVIVPLVKMCFWEVNANTQVNSGLRKGSQGLFFWLLFTWLFWQSLNPNDSDPACTKLKSWNLSHMFYFHIITPSTKMKQILKYGPYLGYMTYIA